MTTQQTTDLACPGCGAASQFHYHASVNVTLEPELKARVLDGSLARFRCEQCGHEARVAHDLLYHDMQRRLLVQLDASGRATGDSFDATMGAIGQLFGGAHLEHVTRVVRSHNELIEKVRLSDADLDDRVFEVFKLLLRAQRPDLANGAWYFDGTEDDALNLVVVIDQRAAGLSVPRAAYDKLADRLAQLGTLDEQPRWAAVDQRYARTILEPMVANGGDGDEAS